MKRELELPTAETDKVGQKVTLTVEAWIVKIEADLVDISTQREPDIMLLADHWTTFIIGQAQRT